MISITNLGALGFSLAMVDCIYLPLNYSEFSLVSLYRKTNLYYLLLQVLLVLLAAKSQERLSICLTGFCLGVVCCVGVQNCSSPFGLYLMILSTFHFTEFLTTGLTNPQNLSFDSYLVNHSREYGIAAIASWTEYFVERFLFSRLKSYPPVTAIGLVFCIVGEVVRKLAMFHAGTNFNHLVQDRKQKEHILVTAGIYSIFRHPSYVGWFLWSIGTQLVLVNPICFLGYSVVSFLFFKERIFVEEYNLIAFFGEEYREYQKKVWSGIPFIPGYHGPIYYKDSSD